MTGEAPRLRQSIAKLLLTECPLIALQALEGERRHGNKAMRRGTLVDQLVFGGAQYEVVSEVYKSGPRKGQEATDWTGTAAREKRDAIEARGYVPCLPAELEAAQELAGRIKAELLLAGLDLGKCTIQETMQWQTPLGVAAEGTYDAAFAIEGGNLIHTIDLKVGEDANPEKLDNQVDAMMWDMQGAVYQEALTVTRGSFGSHWICRVDANTKIVGLYPLDEGYMHLGLKKWEAAQAIWRRCVEKNEWPQYARRPIRPSKRATSRALEAGYLSEEQAR